METNNTAVALLEALLPTAQTEDALGKICGIDIDTQDAVIETFIEQGYIQEMPGLSKVTGNAYVAITMTGRQQLVAEYTKTVGL